MGELGLKTDHVDCGARAVGDLGVDAVRAYPSGDGRLALG